MIRNVIVMGDATTHGGNVIHASSMIVVDGKNVALVGDLVSCPKCKGVYPIIEGTEKVFFMGQPAALEGMQTACGARLIASQNRMFVNDGIGINQVSQAVGDQKEDKKVKKIVELYWSYGDGNAKLDEKSRHYVDVNLHIVTENYQAGETVDAVIEYEGEHGTEELPVSGTVNNEGQAIVKNVLKNNKIFILGEE